MHNSIDLPMVVLVRIHTYMLNAFFLPHSPILSGRVNNFYRVLASLHGRVDEGDFVANYEISIVVSVNYFT